MWHSLQPALYKVKCGTPYSLPFPPTSAAQASGTFTTKSWLERVVVLGYPTTPKSVKITSSNLHQTSKSSLPLSSSPFLYLPPRCWCPGPSVYIQQFSAAANHSQTRRQHSIGLHHFNQLESCLLFVPSFLWGNTTNVPRSMLYGFQISI